LDDEPTPPAEGEAPAPLPAPPEAHAELIATGAALARFCRLVARSPQVALDTEANSMHAYRERTCIAQLTAGGESAIVDVLAVGDLAPLRRALDRDDVEVLLHGGDYDITVLTRDHDLRFSKVFDTMIAATLLGEPRVGLADLVEKHFGYRLDKRFQRADWARRPLTDEQLDYLQRDTIYLPELRKHFGERLAAADLEEEARIEFDRLARRRGRPVEFDPEGWRRIKGARRLGGTGRAVLRALHLWREREAEKRDLAPFKVLAPRAMLQIAEQPPKSPRHPGDVPFIGPRDRRRHGRAILEALERGLASARKGDVPPERLTQPLDAQARRAAQREKKRTDRLKAWRRKEAARRDVPNVVVLPNPAVEWLARGEPHVVADLAACEDIGTKRVERYGEKIIDLLGEDTG
jgi:ribonuclease D